MIDQPTGTVDVTNLVENLRSSFVKWGVAYVFGLELGVPALEWVGLPIIKDIDQAAIKMVLDFITKSAVMEAFFMNTAIRKAAQADDYVAAVNALLKLPPTTSEADYAQAEQNEILAFRNFVMVSN